MKLELSIPEIAGLSAAAIEPCAPDQLDEQVARWFEALGAARKRISFVQTETREEGWPLEISVYEIGGQLAVVGVYRLLDRAAAAMVSGLGTDSTAEHQRLRAALEAAELDWRGAEPLALIELWAEP